MTNDVFGLNTTSNNPVRADKLSSGGSVKQPGLGESDQNPEVTQGITVTDQVTLSAEAVALASNVPPVIESSETQQQPAVERGGEEGTQQPVQSTGESPTQSPYGTVDIQA